VDETAGAKGRKEATSQKPDARKPRSKR
jgi:hypothetical protein